MSFSILKQYLIIFTSIGTGIICMTLLFGTYILPYKIQTQIIIKNFKFLGLLKK